MYALFLRRRLFFLAGLSILVNCLTNPSANLLYTFWPNLLLVELGVIVTETLLLYWLMSISLRRAVILSLTANIVSFATGLWLLA